MGSWMDVLLYLLSTLIPTLSAIASLAYWLGGKFAEMNSRLVEMDGRLGRLENALT